MSFNDENNEMTQLGSLASSGFRAKDVPFPCFPANDDHVNEMTYILPSTPSTPKLSTFHLVIIYFERKQNAMFRWRMWLVSCSRPPYQMRVFHSFNE